MSVTVLEKRRQIGGRAYQLRDRGYVFDMGPSLITAPHLIDSIFQAGGRRLVDYVDLIPLDPYYRVYFHDGTHIDYSGDLADMKAQMARFDAGDADRLDAFLEAVRPIYDTVIGDRLGSKPFDTVGSMLRFLPRMARMNAYRPVTAFVNRFFRDPRHRFLFSFHPLFVGGESVPDALDLPHDPLPGTGGRRVVREGGDVLGRGGARTARLRARQ